MGRVGEVKAYEDGAVRVDAGGGDDETADHFAPAGDDAPPLAGDIAALSDAPGAGSESAVGYRDDTTKKSADGEKRIYSRKPDGSLAAEFWLKGDGTWVMTDLLNGASFSSDSDGAVTINGVKIDSDGNIETPGDVDADGDVTANAAVPAASVTLSTHQHPTAATGSPSPPTPGT